MPLNDTQKVRREGFAYALAIDLFPRLRKDDPAAFDRDVQALYEYMLQPPKHGGDPLHHLNLSKPNPDTLKNAEQWLTGPRNHPSPVFQQLSSGHAAQAAHTLGFDYETHQLPVALKGGYLNPDTSTGHGFSPSKGLHAVEHAGSTIGHGVASGAKDVGGAVTGIAGWVGKNAMLLVLLVVIVLIVKK